MQALVYGGPHQKLEARPKPTVKLPTDAVVKVTKTTICDTDLHILKGDGDHRHTGIAMLTPADVHFGRAPQVLAARQRVLDGAYARHPERFSRQAPCAELDGGPLMRRALLFVALLMSIFAASCSKEDEHKNHDMSKPGTSK